MTHGFKKFDKSLVGEALEKAEGKEYRDSYGKMDGSMKGRKEGGRGRNKTLICRNPKSKLNRGKRR